MADTIPNEDFTFVFILFEFKSEQSTYGLVVVLASSLRNDTHRLIGVRCAVNLDFLEFFAEFLQKYVKEGGLSSTSGTSQDHFPL